MNEKTIQLISSNKTREVDQYNLVVKYQNEYWAIKNMDFNSYKITIRKGSTEMKLHFNECEVIEHF